ncbi:hypothetical protein FNV43_RR05679 [Rhamnella rubrinervis]|uniref:Uncharacterized protein n=1 Tax=Rhamnella rubrinervis TaxID=2594499 RepID=A0A8K0HMI9_9ROSA|nr:hypothetical protein FNV43_RR05679 [Rhamnella rubrinervis]
MSKSVDNISCCTAKDKGASGQGTCVGKLMVDRVLAGISFELTLMSLLTWLATADNPTDMVERWNALSASQVG